MITCSTQPDAVGTYNIITCITQPDDVGTYNIITCSTQPDAFQYNFFISLLFHLFFLILNCSYQYSYNLMLTSNRKLEEKGGGKSVPRAPV